ncbi:MAG: LysR substrate-binding domain-containing protein [Beijerinckiaceae bacterium]
MSELPPLHALQAFRAVMRAGGFAPAAQALGVTASAVSHRIRELEATLGVALFERRNRSVFPTDAAQRYHETVAEALDRMAAATRVVGERRGAAVLAVHASPTFAAQWLMPRLKGFIAAHPEIDVRLSSTPEAATLADGMFDIDVQYARPTPDGCESAPFATENVMPLCAPSVLEAAAGMLSIEALARLPLLHSVRNIVRWERWFALNGAGALPSARGMHFDRSFLAIAAAADGLGVCLESTHMAERELRAGKLVAPFPGMGIRAVGHRIVWRAEPGAPPKTRAFLAWLKAQAQASSARLRDHTERRELTASAP